MATTALRSRVLFLQCLTAICLMSWSVHCGDDKIPDYIDICKRNDPELNKCVWKSIEDLKPKLLKGIPELNVPAMDPMIIPKLTLSVEGISHDSYGENIKVHGLADFKVTDVKVDLEKRDFGISIEIAAIYMEGHLEIRMDKLKQVKGSGPFTANATDLTVTVDLQDQLVERDGKQYMNFTSCKNVITIKKVNMQIGDVFHGQQFLTNLTNEFVRQHPGQMVHTILPSMQKMVGDMICENANDLTNRFSYDELFPPS